MVVGNARSVASYVIRPRPIALRRVAPGIVPLSVELWRVVPVPGLGIIVGAGVVVPHVGGSTVADVLGMI